MKTDIQTRYEYLELYVQGKIKQKELSQALKISRQQTYRLVKRYQSGGILSLQHRNKHQPSHNSFNADKKSEILLLIKDKYYDCGPSYAS